MSKGSPIKTMRFSEDLVKRIEAAMDSANGRRFAEPYHWSSWVLKAVTEKLRHLERGRSSRKSRRKPSPAAAVSDQAVSDQAVNGEQ